MFKIKETDTITGKVHITAYGFKSRTVAEIHCEFLNEANPSIVYTVQEV